MQKSPHQRHFNDTRAEMSNAEESDYADMTPKGFSSQSINSHISPMRNPMNQNQLSSHNFEIDNESDYADMTGNQKLMKTVPCADDGNYGDYACMTGFRNDLSTIKQPKPSRTTTKEFKESLKVSTSLEKINSFTNGNWRTDITLQSSSGRAHSPKSFDCVDGTATISSLPFHVKSHTRPEIREGSFYKDDEDDYDSVDTFQKTFSPPHIDLHKSEAESSKSPSIRFSAKRENNYQPFPEFRSRSSELVRSPTNSVSDQAFKNVGNNMSVKTAAGKAAKKYLQLQPNIQSDLVSVEKHRSASCGVIRSTSRASSRPGGVQSRITKQRQSPSFRTEGKPDRFSLPLLQQTQSMQNLPVQRQSPKVKTPTSETTTHPSRTFSTDEEEYFNLEKEVHRAESFHKYLSKGTDGSNMMKYISNPKQSRSLDKTYLDWLRKTTAFTSRTVSSASIGTDPRSPTYSKKEKRLESVESLQRKDGDTVFDDEEEEDFQRYLASFSNKAQKGKMLKTEQQDEEFASPASPGRNDKRGRKSPSKNEKSLNHEEPINFTEKTKFKMSIKFKGRKKKQKGKSLEKIDSSTYSYTTLPPSEVIIDVAEAEQCSEIKESVEPKHSLNARHANTLMPTIKPPLGPSSPKITAPLSNKSSRTRALSSSSMSSLSSKSDTIERKPEFSLTTGHRRNKSDLINSRQLTGGSTPNLIAPVLDISLASNYEDDEVTKPMRRTSSKNKIFSSKSNTLGRLFSKRYKERKSLDNIQSQTDGQSTSIIEDLQGNKPRAKKSLSLQETSLKAKLQGSLKLEIGSPLPAAQAYMLQANLVHGFVTKHKNSGSLKANLDHAVAGIQKIHRFNKYATISNMTFNSYMTSPKKTKNNWIPDLDTVEATWVQTNMIRHPSETESTADERDEDSIRSASSIVDEEEEHEKGLTLRRQKLKLLPLFKNPSTQAVQVARLLYQCIKESQPRILRDDLDDDELTDCFSAIAVEDNAYAEDVHQHCVKGSELVTWLQLLIEANDRLRSQKDSHYKAGTAVSRWMITGMWQVLLEEGILFHVDREEQFEDSEHYYRFQDDIKSFDAKNRSHLKETHGTHGRDAPKINNNRNSTSELITHCLEATDVSDALSFLQKNHHDAMFRKALREEPQKRSTKELMMIYNEILHIKALAHLSDSVKRELAGVLKFECHHEEGKILFKQGDEGTSWFIVLRGTVKVDVTGKGVVCILGEGDDFGNLALVNEAPRAASIILAEDNCHFMRVDKLDFVSILKDVEANTVRLKEHGDDVLILEKIVSPGSSPRQKHIEGSLSNIDSSLSPKRFRYSVKAGSPERILEHILEYLQPWTLHCYDELVEDFILMHITFMKTEDLCKYLLQRYHSEKTSDCPFEKSLKRKIVYFVVRWSHILIYLRTGDEVLNNFLKELKEEIDFDCISDDTYAMVKDEFSNLYRLEEKDEMETFLMTKGGIRRCETGERGSAWDKPIKASDQVLMKIYNSEKSYTTHKVPVLASAEEILGIVADKLNQPRDNIRIFEVQESGDAYEIRKRQRSVATFISLNSHLCVCSVKESCQPVSVLPRPWGKTNMITLEQSISDSLTLQSDTVSSLEIAYHVTQHDWELLNNVHVMEYVYKVFGAHKFNRVTANLDLLVQRFNQLAYWAPTEICTCSNVGKRAQILRKFIKIAQHLKAQQNMNAFMAIMIGIGNQAISRMTNTWEKLPARYKKVVQEFEAVLDPSRNHRAYRIAIEAMDPPVIPYLPLLLKDMTFLHEGNDNTTNQLVNFEKMKMFSNSVRSIVRGCGGKMETDQLLSSTKTAEETKRYVESLQVITDQRTLNNLSAKLEPKR